MESHNENRTNGTATLKIRISAELKEEMDRVARQREISSSALTRLAIRNYIEELVARKEPA